MMDDLTFDQFAYDDAIRCQFAALRFQASGDHEWAAKYWLIVFEQHSRNLLHESAGYAWDRHVECHWLVICEGEYVPKHLKR